MRVDQPQGQRLTRPTAMRRAGLSQPEGGTERTRLHRQELLRHTISLALTSILELLGVAEADTLFRLTALAAGAVQADSAQEAQAPQRNPTLSRSVEAAQDQRRTAAAATTPLLDQSSHPLVAVEG